jgi:hypothetical protein
MTASAREPEHQVEVFLSRPEVARYIGLKDRRSLSGITLPPHDAEVGIYKGWRRETIDAWQAARPGHGRWGPRGSVLH